jgi:hypothetical protein
MLFYVLTYDVLGVYKAGYTRNCVLERYACTHLLYKYTWRPYSLHTAQVYLNSAS